MQAALLSGITVVESAEGLSAAYCGRILAELGAEVLKIERPGSGDPLRHEGPFASRAPYAADSALFAYVTAGKRSLTLDADRPTGAALLERLLDRSELLIASNGVHGSRAGGALAGDRVRTRHPRLVRLTITPHGLSGAERERATSDLVVQHFAGWAYHQAAPVAEPARTPPVGGADREAPLAAGVAAAMAAMWGLLMVQAGHAAPDIDAAVADFYAHLLVEATGEWSRGERRFARRRGSDGGGATVAGGNVWILPCADGFVMISPREDHQWQRWIEVLEHPAWTTDPALCGDRKTRRANGFRLQALMGEWSIKRTRSEVFERAQAARVACFPISTPADLLTNPQLEHRGFFHRWLAGNGTTVPLAGLPFQMRTSDGTELPRARTVRVPALGEANDDIFVGRLGLSHEALEELQRHGVI
jgi:crotonobetainyl-CoA:carnitine CoA-transferase CaiB-like acyl-CoA transferase